MSLVWADTEYLNLRRPLARRAVFDLPATNRATLIDWKKPLPGSLVSWVSNKIRSMHSGKNTGCP